MKSSDYPLKRRSMIQAAAGVAAVSVASGCLGDDDDVDDTTADDSDDGDDAVDDTDDAPAEPGEPVGEITIEVGELTNFTDIAQEVGRSWEELGVDVSIQTDTWGPYVPRIYAENDYEHSAHSPWGSSPDRIDPDFFLSTYESDATLNIAGYSNPELDDLIAEQRAAFDPEERADIIADIQDILHRDLPEVTFVWAHATLPHNSAQWDITPTEFMGARTTATMSVLTAESVGDEDRLIVGAEQELDAPNPLAPDSNDLQFLFKYAYDTPFRVDLDGEAIPWAVEEFEEVEPGVLDLTLRDGMTFHDGESVTADDLKFTFDFLSGNSFPAYDGYVAPIENTEVETDLTTRVELESPNVAFINSALTFIKLLPEHIWAPIGEDEDEPINYNASVEDGDLVGSGPLRLTDWTGTELHYERYEDHFHQVDFDEFLFVNRASMEAVRSSFEAQEIHMTTSSPPPSVTEALAENDFIGVTSAPGILQMKFSFDLASEPFDDVDFRWALAKTVDPQRIADVFYDGNADIGDGTLLHPLSELTSDHLPQLEQDIDGARARLEDAGYSWDDDGNLLHPE